MTRKIVRSTVAAVLVLILATNSALAATAVPFSYTVDFKVNLPGREMTSSTGTFCNWFHTTYVQRPDLDTWVWITLYEPGGDYGYGIQVGNTLYYRADGLWHAACWSNFQPNTVYFFRYQKNNNTFSIRGEGNVQNHPG